MTTFLIGFGRMGQRHYEILQKVVGGEIIVFDVNRGPFPSHPTLELHDPSDLNPLLQERKPKLVVIATTAPSHADYLKTCIAQDVPFILCEKPVCVSIEEANEIERLLVSHLNTKIAVNHQMRYMEQYTRIKEYIDSGEFGSLSSISVQAGNFGAAMNGTHYFEMFRYLTGELPHRVWAWLKPQSSPNPRGNNFQDSAGSIRIESKSGKRFYMDVSEDQGHGLFVTYSCAVGQIHVDELQGLIYVSRRKNADDLDLPTTRYGMPAHVEKIQIRPADALEPTESVLGALLEGRGYPSFQDGVMAMKTLVAAYASSESDHKAVQLDQLPNAYNTRVFPWA